MTLSSKANCINLIILMATNYRCKKYFNNCIIQGLIMFCKNCGSQMNDDAAFCPNCGSKNDSKSNVSYNNVSTGQKNHKPFPVAPIIIAIFVVVAIFGVNAFLNRTCSMCDRKVFKKGLCREHYSEQLVKDNVKVLFLEIRV